MADLGLATTNPSTTGDPVNQKDAVSFIGTALPGQRSAIKIAGTSGYGTISLREHSRKPRRQNWVPRSAPIVPPEVTFPR